MNSLKNGSPYKRKWGLIGVRIRGTTWGIEIIEMSIICLEAVEKQPA